MTKSRAAKLLALILLGALGLKAWLIASKAVPFNGDEAIVALMARHILDGARPIFFYGQHYMGSLDAYLLAGGFFLLGESVTTIRIVQTLLFIGTLLASYLAARRLTRSRRVALLTALLLAFPPVLLTLYTSATLGGYGEALLVGSILIWLGHRLAREDKYGWGLWLAWGLLAGIGFWCMGLVMVYAVPMALWMAWELRRPAQSQTGSPLAFYASRLSVVACGFLVGSLPWWLGGGARGIARLLTTQAQESTTAMAFAYDVVERAFHFFVLGLPALFGLRFPWSASGPPLWLAVPALALYLGALGFAARQWRDDRRSSLAPLWGICFILLLGFVLTPYGNDPSGRYFLPLFLPMAIFTAQALAELHQHVRHWTWALLALVLAFNLVGTVQAALTNPPGVTTQFAEDSRVDHRFYDELIQFLRAKGETRGYATYWIAYPLAFLSDEEIILVPRLPYKADLRYTSRDDRYEPYGEIVEASSRVAYVTSDQPALNERLRQAFCDLGVDFREREISSYHVFYDLSRKVRPAELSIGNGQ